MQTNHSNDNKQTKKKPTVRVKQAAMDTATSSSTNQAMVIVSADLGNPKGRSGPPAKTGTYAAQPRPGTLL